jgi:hypothetical protein
MADTAINAMARADQAARELRETEGAFDAVRQAMIEELLGTGINDQASRERLFLAIRGLDVTRQTLRRVIDAGKVEEAAVAVRQQFPKLN